MVIIVVVYGLCLTSKIIYVVRVFVCFIYEILRLIGGQPDKELKISCYIRLYLYGDRNL